MRRRSAFALGLLILIIAIVAVTWQRSGRVVMQPSMMTVVADPDQDGLRVPIHPLAVEWLAEPARESIVANPVNEQALSGHVVADTGAPPPGFALELRQGSLTWNETANSGAGAADLEVASTTAVNCDPQNRFELSRPGSGSGELTSAQPGWIVHPRCLFQPALALAPLVVHVTRAPLVEVLVADPLGSPITDALIRVTATAAATGGHGGAATHHERLTRERRSDREGRAVLRDLPAGDYSASVVGDDFVALEVFALRDVDLTVRVVVREPTPTTVRVIDAANQAPIGGAQVQVSMPLADADSAMRVIRTDANGEARLTHRSDLLAWSVTASGYSTWSGLRTQAPTGEVLVAALSQIGTPAVQVIDQQTAQPIVGARVEYVLWPRDDAALDGWMPQEPGRQEALPPGCIRDRTLTDGAGIARIPFDESRHHPRIPVAATAEGFGASRGNLFAGTVLGREERALRLGRLARLTLLLPEEFMATEATRILLIATFTGDRLEIRWRNDEPCLAMRPSGLSSGLPELTWTRPALSLDGLSAGECWTYFGEEPLLAMGSIDLLPGDNTAPLDLAVRCGVRFDIVNWQELAGYRVTLTPMSTSSPVAYAMRGMPSHEICGPGPIELGGARPGRYQVVALPPRDHPGKGYLLHDQAVLTSSGAVVDLGTLKIGTSSGAAH